MSKNNKFELVLNNAINLPFVEIDRTKFLKSALTPYYDEETVNKAISHNPAYAGISVDEINKIANSAINLETNKTTGLSFVSGLPGGFAMVGTVPADIAQYFGHLLRILQKLVYLYGWQELFDENGNIDDETQNIITLFMGVMFGVNGATKAIVKISESAMQRTAKSLAQRALTKGTVYPIVKKVATVLGVKMTRDVFAKNVAKTIPILGGIASGGLTYATYKPMAIRLKNHLTTLKFADVDFYANSKVIEEDNEAR